MAVFLFRPDQIGDQILRIPVASIFRLACHSSYRFYLQHTRHSDSKPSFLCGRGPNRAGSGTVPVSRDLVSQRDAVICLKLFRRLMIYAFVGRVSHRVAMEGPASC